MEKRVLHDDGHQQIRASIENDEITLTTWHRLDESWFEDIEDGIALPLASFDSLHALVVEHRIAAAGVVVTTEPA